jgi:hypothetical protein
MKIFFLLMILFNSAEANNWHFIRLAKHLKTEVSFRLQKAFIVSSEDFILPHLWTVTALAAIFSTIRSLWSICNTEWAAYWVFRWGNWPESSLFPPCASHRKSHLWMWLPQNWSHHGRKANLRQNRHKNRGEKYSLGLECNFKEILSK